jgi:hypothetical protein
MRVSEYYKLDRTQPELDFVDVDIIGDVPLFIDPHAIRLLDSDWGEECVFLIQDCFKKVISALGSGNITLAHNILNALREPNETHLGLSKGPSRGRALGDGLATAVADSLTKSEAVKTGLLEDLEDTILMVENVGPDRISDIATTIMRSSLITYTQDMCRLYDIPMKEVASGPLWIPAKSEWLTDYVSQPVTNNNKLLLVPKAIVRYHMDYDPDEYYRLYILEYLRNVELSSNTALVKLLKNGSRYVTNKDLAAKYGTGKATSVEVTRKYPEVLAKYHSFKKVYAGSPPDHLDLSIIAGTDLPDWDKLLNDVVNLPMGTDNATDYQHKIEKLLSALFSPYLSYPHLEKRIHEGRKRIDIEYTNVATSGFFKWVGDHAPAPHVFIECKNYSRDIANPELDQISGRFSPRRGKFGIIVCRKLEDKELFIKRCRDTADDDHGFIVPLDDDDMKVLVDQVRDINRASGDYPLLRQLYDRLLL